MRKFLLLLFVLFFGLNVFATDENMGFRGPLNFFQSKILEKIISVQVEKVVGGNIKTKITSYGAKALRNGIFKSAFIEGKNLSFDGINISGFVAETTTENNRLDISDKSNPKLLTDIQADFKTVMSNEDLKTIITAPICQNEIKKLNKNLAPLVRVNTLNVWADKGRLKFRVNLSSGLFGSEFSISGSTSVFSDGNKIVIKDMEISKKTQFANNILSLLNSLNPINLVIKQLDNANIDILVNNINIIDDKIEIFGIIKIYRGV